MHAELNGKVVLLYQQDEEAAITSARQTLLDVGIIAIPCKNPNNFRFVVPEIVAATQVDLIGRLALQALGSDKPLTTFAMAVRQALAPPIAIPAQAEPKGKR